MVACPMQMGGQVNLQRVAQYIVQIFGLIQFIVSQLELKENAPVSFWSFSAVHHHPANHLDTRKPLTVPSTWPFIHSCSSWSAVLLIVFYRNVPTNYSNIFYTFLWPQALDDGLRLVALDAEFSLSFPFLVDMMRKTTTTTDDLHGFCGPILTSSDRGRQIEKWVATAEMV